MVQRRLLTPDFVNTIHPPQKGERWIADTQIRGFGLRLFASGKLGKSFSIRVMDEQGFSIRKSFDIYRSRTYRFRLFEDRDELKFGDFLHDARIWARQEISKLKHLNLTVELDHQDREEVANLVRKLPLGRAAFSLIDGLKAAGRKEAYRDGLYSIMKYVPSQLLQKSLGETSPEEMAEALVNKNIDPANIRKLRSLIGQIYNQANTFGTGLRKFGKEFSKEFNKRIETQYDPYPELRRLKPEDYQRVFECLDAKRDHWQQAMCIRLYFELGSPLTRLMRAEWRAIYNDYWYPYLPSDKKYWFESREYLKEKAWNDLVRINENVNSSFGESLYLFPSGYLGCDKPISTVEPVWRSVLRECGLPYYPLRNFAIRFGRRRNNPSYYPMLNYYLDLWRELENAAELSKIVTERYDSPITSKTYRRSVALPQT